MKKFFTIILFFVSILIFPQYDLSITAFKSQKNIYQIFYDIQFYSKNITYKELDDNNKGILHIKVFVKNLENSQEVYDEWNSISYITKNQILNEDMFLLDRASFLLSPAKYEFKSLIIDSFSQKEYSRVDTVELSKMDSLNPFLSDIIVGYTVRKDSIEDKFSRNGYVVIPNPSKNYNLINPLIYLFFEIYNLHNKEYRIEYKIFDEKDSLVSTISGQKRFSPAFDFVVINYFNTLGFKDGKYRVDVNLIYSDTNILKKSINFFKSSTMFKSQQVKYNLSDEQLKYYSLIDYIATTSELSQFKSLKEKRARHNFLIDFWERRDPDKTNQKLEALDDFIKKVKYVNEKFSSGGEEGYRSARGKIYLKYGPPDETLLIPMSKESKNYDSWIYYSRGGMQFIFVDVKGFGKYELIYTNVLEEDIPQNWRNYIFDTNIIQFYRN